MCRQFDYLILAMAITSTLAAGRQRPQPPAGSAPGAIQPRREPLTDRDVIQIVDSGRPEAAILATIRSTRRPFNPTVAPINIPKTAGLECRLASSKVALAKPSLSQTDLDSPRGDMRAFRVQGELRDRGDRMVVRTS